MNFVCLSLLGLLAIGGEQAKFQPKSVVLILIDDLRYDGARSLGNPSIDTPNIDRLTAEGVNFRRAFVTTSLCSPSRASILTGQYMHRHGVFDNNVNAKPGTKFFPELLKAAGYQTAFIGKWHMGGESDSPRPGFDRWISFKGQGHYTSTPSNPNQLNIDGKSVPRKGYITDELTDYACDWLGGIDRQKPFFLMLSHKAVHAPFQPAKRHQGKYRDLRVNLPKPDADFARDPGVPMWVKNQRNSWHGIDYPYHSNLDLEEYYRAYLETLLSVDDSVGKVRSTLEQLKIADDCLIIFTGDNGFFWGEHGLIDKRCAYEESIRVPLLVHCPKHFSAKTCDKLVANIDFAPTILELAGIQKPSSMDGTSFVPLLAAKEQSAVPWRDALLYEYYWEWNFPQTPTMFAVRTEHHKFIEYHGIWDTDELFNLDTDPQERRNMIRDPKHHQLARKMRQKLANLRKETDADVMPIGRKQGDGANLRRKDGATSAAFPDNIFRPE